MHVQDFMVQGKEGEGKMFGALQNSFLGPHTFTKATLRMD